MPRPCHLPVDKLAENFERLEKFFGVHKPAEYNKEGMSEEHLQLLASLEDPASKLFIQNTTTICDKTAQAVNILPAVGKKHLYYTLCLNTSDEVPALGDSKLGGVPDLTRYFRLKDKTGKFNTEEIWPRCGCCHKYMQFVAQVDLYPWLMPLHVLSAEFSKNSYRKDEYGLYSSVGNIRMVQHHSIHKAKFFHIFMCPDAGQHWDNLNGDAVVLITDVDSDRLTRLNKDDNRPEPPPFDYDAYYDSLPVKETLFSPTKITGVDFKINIEREWDKKDVCEDIVEAHPDIFVNYHDDYEMFGLPRSQQDPKRYNTTNSYIPQREMTPLISFNHPHDDYTYQIYADLQGSDGNIAYGKVDGSCT